MVQERIAPSSFSFIDLEHEQAIRRMVDLLFIFTDQKVWSRARQLFVDGLIDVDMSSLNGGGPVRMTADELLAGFAVGLHAEKESHHMTTNVLITINQNTAEVEAHGYAWNRLSNYHGGSDLWETWGDYRLTLQRTPAGWLLDGLHYLAKYNRGNELVRTHTLSSY